MMPAAERGLEETLIHPRAVMARKGGDWKVIFYKVEVIHQPFFLSSGLSIDMVCPQHSGQPVLKHSAEFTRSVLPHLWHHTWPRFSFGSDSANSEYMLLFKSGVLNN